MRGGVMLVIAYKRVGRYEGWSGYEGSRVCLTATEELWEGGDVSRGSRY